MSCILKSCAHSTIGACKTFAKSGLGECGAAYALELASRNDGYLVHGGNNPTIEALRKAGMITTTRTADGPYVLARVVNAPPRPYHRADRPQTELSCAARIGQGINLNEETFA